MEHISGGALRNVTGMLVKNSDVYQVRKRLELATDFG